MSNKSGISEQIISTPKGGGALSGIGEKFSPDLFTGTGNFTVPIALPPGRNGFQPELNLLYSTGNGNGPFGMGWSLSIPSISRKTSKGIPRYLDSENDLGKRDTFILSGAEDLVVVADEAGKTRYRPRTEGLFARITHHHGAGENYWQVESKDGLVSFYGTQRPEDSPGGWQDPCIIADPARRERIFAWKLSETRDPFGNRILYEYERDQSADHQWDQLYLKCIRYADYVDDGGEEHFFVSVNFNYETLPARYAHDIPDVQRIYPVADHRAGFEIRTCKRCAQIAVHTHADADRLVRTYDLLYLDQLDDFASLANRLPRNGASLLNRICVTGHDLERTHSEQTQSLPPLEFGYAHFAPEQEDFFAIEDTDIPSESLDSATLELADLFGNGLPDILEMNGDMPRYWRNLGGGHFDLPRTMAQAPFGLSLADEGVQLIDATGDGRVDLLASSNGLSGYYPLTFDGGWDRRSFQRIKVAPSVNLEAQDVRLLDLDGDGVTDVLRTGARLECFFNDPKHGYSATNVVSRQPLSEFPDVYFTDPRIKICDLTGDGLQDIAFIQNGCVEYWPNLGHGNWGKRVTMHDSPHLPAVQWNNLPQIMSRVLLGDIDGDGLADMVFVDSGQVTIWINQGGAGWSSPTVIPHMPLISDSETDSVRLVDLLGTGIRGLLWTKAFSLSQGNRYFFLDFTAEGKPYLLNEMDNHMGAVTKVAYEPSTNFYLRDEERSGTRWQTPLPFPVQVVARVEVIDEISQGKLTTEYRYHHGYWDGVEREFRGFGRVDQLDTETFAEYHTSGLHGSNKRFTAVPEEQFSPPTLTKMWFHVGPVDVEEGGWREADYSHEYWNGDPSKLERPSEFSAYLRNSNVNPRTKRNAVRALRGRILRTELFALDGTARADRPYTVTESLHSVAPLPIGTDWAATTEWWQEKVLFPHILAQRTTQWERGDDPMTGIVFSDDYDQFGQPQRQTNVAMPRRQKCRKPVTGAVVNTIAGDEVNETRILATHTHMKFAIADNSVYIADRVAESMQYELSVPPVSHETNIDNLEQILAEQIAMAQDVHQRFMQAQTDSVRLIGHTRNHYDGLPFVGRETGKVGSYGALTRSEVLVFSDIELARAYDERRPSYLGGSAELPSGKPQNFGNNLGYHAEVDATGQKRYYADLQRQMFDFQNDTLPPPLQRGLIVATEDALGSRTTLEIEQPYWLLPASIIDAKGIVMKAEYDCRIHQPKVIIDPNGVKSLFRYTPLGLLDRQFLKGAAGEGGSEAHPEKLFQYDFDAFMRTRGETNPQPISVHTTLRVFHASQNRSDEIIESREYSDGFGRLIQARTQAEVLIFGETGDDVGLPIEPGSVPGAAHGIETADSLSVSGWQVYNNKGQVVETYEPLFASGWLYQPDQESKYGVHACFYYDPRGQLIRTVNPDGSEQRVIFGIPRDLRDPIHFSPSSWESYVYDPNDLAPLSHSSDTSRAHNSLENRASAEHHYTPTSTIVDALGRIICQVERDHPERNQGWIVTRSSYDMLGNLVEIRDAFGRRAFTYAYDLLKNRLRTDSIDAGLHTAVLDANGNIVEVRDAKGSIELRRYDVLNRLTHLWARNGPEQQLTLREKLVYGDDGDHESARRNYRLGRLHEHYDEAGLQRMERYDFKGNLVEKARQVISDTAIAVGWKADWSATDSVSALDSAEYRTSTNFDALNRPIEIVYPTDVNGARAKLTPTYNRASMLQAIELDEDPYVDFIGYNAKGQRVLIAYGNQITTRYAYAPTTFRLARMRTERGRRNGNTWSGSGNSSDLLQDFTYTYDLAGNIRAIDDRAPNCGIANSTHGRDRLLRTFDYDPFYRLTAATGRACKDIGVPRPLADLARCGAYTGPYQSGIPTTNRDNAPDLTERYTESYVYDPAGNMLAMRYDTANSNWTRRFGFDGQAPAQWAAAGANRLTALTQNGDTHHFQYDENGNMRQQNTERRYAWDHADRLIAFTNQPSGTQQPTVEARYLYGADGMRVKKWVRNQQGQVTSTAYIEGIFEQHRLKTATADRTNNTLHVMDDESRIAMVRVGPPLDDRDASPPIQYHIGDHLGSSHVVVGGENHVANTFVNREEYFPYGETSFGSFGQKRYRYSGKERDGETQLYYYGARYYAPWLGNWLSCDPLGPVDSINLNSFVRRNPTRFFDRNGLSASTTADPQQSRTVGQASGDTQLISNKDTGYSTHINRNTGVITPTEGTWFSKILLSLEGKYSRARALEVFERRVGDEWVPVTEADLDMISMTQDVRYTLFSKTNSKPPLPGSKQDRSQQLVRFKVTDTDPLSDVDRVEWSIGIDEGTPNGGITTRAGLRGVHGPGVVSITADLASVQFLHERPNSTAQAELSTPKYSIAVYYGDITETKFGDHVITFGGETSASLLDFSYGARKERVGGVGGGLGASVGASFKISATANHEGLKFITVGISGQIFGKLQGTYDIPF